MEGSCVFLTLDAASYCFHGQPSLALALVVAAVSL